MPVNAKLASDTPATKRAKLAHVVNASGLVPLTGSTSSLITSFELFISIPGLRPRRLANAEFSGAVR